MFNFTGNFQLSTFNFQLLTLFLFLVSFNACVEQGLKKFNIEGEAQGTTYSITYYSAEGGHLKKEAIDSLLLAFDFSLSTYNPASIVSRINNNDTSVIVDDYFKTVFEKSREVSTLSDNLFDVTIAPVVNAWGFGFTERLEIDSTVISKLLKNVGQEKIKLVDQRIVKENKEIMLDFNAIAQGYSVDVVADYFISKGITDFLIEIGGEVRASGAKPDGDSWKVGIDKPLESLPVRKLNAVVKLNNKSLATSGNYRKFYEEDGKKYSHTIDPRTGYPAKNNLLSATVVADDCMTADAYATLFMVMGKEDAKKFLDTHKDLGLEVYFLYDENGQIKSYFSQGIVKLIEELN